MKYWLLMLAEFALLIFLVYVTVGLDGTPEVLARIAQGLCIMAAGLTSWKASQVRRKAREENANDASRQSEPGTER